MLDKVAIQIEVSLCLYICSDLGLLSDRGSLHFMRGKANF